MTTRFSKHLGEGNNIVIDGETYLIKPLTTDEAPLFFKVMKMFEEEKGLDFTKLTDESSNAIASIINITLERSFPDDWKADEQEVKRFGMKYMKEVFNAALEANLPDEDKPSGTSIDDLKKAINPQ